jgi:starch-binding outer membrane protein, SusD/RagB family
LRAARITGYVDETFGSSADLVNAVLYERFKELAFEGHRFYDLRRNGLPVVRDPNDADGTWLTLPANSYLFVFPIPQDAVLANPTKHPAKLRLLIFVHGLRRPSQSMHIIKHEK